MTSSLIASAMSRDPPYHIEGLTAPSYTKYLISSRRTLASTNCRDADPAQVPRLRQLRDAPTGMRFRPAHQSMINRRHDDRASCPARQSLKPLLPMEPRIHAPAT